MLRRLLSLLLGLLVTGVPHTEAELCAFSFSYSEMALPLVSGIDARMTEDGLTATVIMGGRDDAEGIVLSKEEIRGLEALIDEHDIWAWAGFDESDNNVLDGEGFSFFAEFADGTTISAHGNNAFPRGYREAKEAILTYIYGVLEAREIALFDA